MDDTLRDTLAGIMERGEGEDIQSDRVRDERGRFAKAEQTETTQPAEPVQQAQQTQQPQEVGDDVAPSSLSGPIKQQWGTLSPEVRREFKKREDDFHKGIGQYKQAAEFGSTMYKAVQPYMQTIQSLGVTPDRAIGALLQADQTFRNGTMQQKRELLGNIIQQYGISFTDEAPQAPQFEPKQFQDQILRNIPDLVNRTLSEREQAREVERAKQEVDAFSSANDRFGLMNEASPDGSPNPFRQLMMSALTSGQAKDLASAYEIAAYAHPVSRQKLLAEQQAKADEDRRKSEAQRIATARRASAMNVRPKGNVPQMPAQGGSMEDTIRDTYQRLRGG